MHGQHGYNMVWYMEHKSPCNTVQEMYMKNRDDFLIQACNKPDYLEEVTGITAMNEAINMDDIEALDDDFDWD